MKHYKLIGHDPVPCDHWLEWAKWYEHAEEERRVGLTEVKGDAGDVVVISTVFLGIDHKWSKFGEPVLFESMVFGGVLAGHMFRYCTWEEAEQGHQQLVDLVLDNEVLADGSDVAQLAQQVIAQWRGGGRT